MRLLPISTLAFAALVALPATAETNKARRRTDGALPGAPLCAAPSAWLTVSNGIVATGDARARLRPARRSSARRSSATSRNGVRAAASIATRSSATRSAR